MAYTPVATDATQPTDDVKASTAAAEFRAIKTYLNGIVAGNLPSQTGKAGYALVTNGTSADWAPVSSMFDFVNFI
jgi:hypothetical protein